MEIKYEPLMRVEIYSHFFKVVRPSPRMVVFLLEFCAKYIQYEWAKEHGRSFLKPSKVYASRVKDNSEFRFHIGQLGRFKEQLDFKFITPDLYETVVMNLGKSVDIKADLDARFTLYGYQEEAVGFVTEDDPTDNHSRLVTIPTGGGKAQPLDAKIKTPTGWVSMGDIKIGDEVIAKDGSVTHVTGIFPQGSKNIVRVTFYDGRSTECCLDHLWRVYCDDWFRPKVLSVKEILRLNSFTKRKRIYIDLIDPQDSLPVDLPIDPYVFGVILGDGCLRNGRLMISTPDEFIVNEIKQRLPKTLTIEFSLNSQCDYVIKRNLENCKTNEYLQILRSLELTGKYSFEKHIPEQYLHGSYEQRLTFLQGLLDTDGTIGTHNTVSFCSTSKKLAEGVQYLIRSLGGIASISEKLPFFTYNGEKKQGRLAYIVNIRFKKPSILFQLPKKKERAYDDHQYAKGLKLRIENIEHVGHKEAQCISIAHPDRLYVTDEFIPTHNTVVACASVAKIKKRTVVAVLPKYIEKWCGDISGNLNVKSKKIMQIKGSGQVQGLIDLAKDGGLNCDYIVFSLVTLKNYIKAYEESPEDCIDEYGCAPEELYSIIQAGTMIIDESHEHLHAVFKILLYTNIDKVIALSGTFLSPDPFIENIQHLMFPKEIRFDKIKMEKYIKVYAVSYSFEDFMAARIRTTEFGSNNYSHNAYEKSILRQKKVTDRYLNLIDSQVKIAYLENFIPGDRLAIYASSIAMCTVITDFLKKKYPHLDIRRYVEDDPYENAIEAQIRVTTIQSCGTALDIPNLRAVILTNSINSPVSNLQVLGRLRKLKDRDVKFYYLYCEQIKKQVEYHRNRRDLFLDRVQFVKEFRSSVYM